MFHECVREALKPPQVITREIPDFPKRILTAAWTIPRVRVGWTGWRQGKMVVDWGYHGVPAYLWLINCSELLYVCAYGYKLDDCGYSATLRLLLSVSTFLSLSVISMITY